jgi:hypothetical protein
MPRLKTETIGTGDMSWMGGVYGLHDCRTAPPDPVLFSAALYPDGVPSGTPCGIVTATKRLGPYTGDGTDEVQTLTEGGSGLTSFTITALGETTDPLDDDATAADVQEALEAIYGAGNVVVTGGPLATGPFVVSFVGELANTDVAAMATTPTGGTGTVVVATTTAGGADGSADGREVLAGFLLTDQPAPGEGGWPLLDHGRIKVNQLPSAVLPFRTTGHNTTGHFIFIEGDV